MYGNSTFAIPAVAGGTAAASLPYTGVSLVWYFLAGFALLAAGLAILRTVPKKQS